MIRPATRIVLGRRAALRRRVGYAALRVLRRALCRAIEDHQSRQLGDAPYDGTGELERIAGEYRSSVRRLQRRWPHLDFSDPRGEP